MGKLVVDIWTSRHLTGLEQATSLGLALVLLRQAQLIEHPDHCHDSHGLDAAQLGMPVRLAVAGLEDLVDLSCGLPARGAQRQSSLHPRMCCMCSSATGLPCPIVARAML